MIRDTNQIESIFSPPCSICRSHSDIAFSCYHSRLGYQIIIKSHAGRGTRNLKWKSFEVVSPVIPAVASIFSNPFKVTVRYCKKRSKLKRQKSEEKQKMRELLFGNSPNNYTQPNPNAPPTYPPSYSTPVYHHQLDNFNGFNPTMRYSMRSERGLPISLVLHFIIVIFIS